MINDYIQLLWHINKMRIITIITLLALIYSCQKRNQNKTTLNIFEHDTLTKSVAVSLSKKYELIGFNDPLHKIILSDETDLKIEGSFGVGIKEITSARNKAFIYVTDFEKRIDSLPKLSNPNDYLLLTEFEKSINESNLHSVLIERDEDALANIKAYKLTFAFMKNQKDTLGFQNTYQLVHKNQLCTINYLSDSREKYYELEKEFEGVALSAY